MSDLCIVLNICEAVHIGPNDVIGYVEELRTRALQIQLSARKMLGGKG